MWGGRRPRASPPPPAAVQWARRGRASWLGGGEAGGPGPAVEERRVDWCRPSRRGRAWLQWACVRELSDSGRGARPRRCGRGLAGWTGGEPARAPPRASAEAAGTRDRALVPVELGGREHTVRGSEGHTVSCILNKSDAGGPSSRKGSAESGAASRRPGRGRGRLGHPGRTPGTWKGSGHFETFLGKLFQDVCVGIPE